ncbi:MAG: hypothetical protein LAT75_14360 [Candidatus Cyclonatronum sp.]|uniref:hypothetical protein n=1 Tax=Cyclonatronum sp. TaxID=3024185 RepID=UPI0025C0FBBC|nr:hypothetical protein [Cyclonatronum sp.]MCH8488042.1 hypothetical protein [Cyclonatronum sp.]
MYLLKVLLFLLVCSGLPSAAAAQQTPAEGGLMVLTSAEGQAFVFLTVPPPLSHGFLVYRRTGSETEWQRLTNAPVMPVQNGFQLQQQLGGGWQLIEQTMPDTDPQSVFLSLRSGSEQNLLTILALPELAEAMGFLFVDAQAPAGQTAAYRIEFVSDIGRSIGVIYETEAELTPIRPLPPQNLSIRHEGRNIIMNWDYPAYDSPGTEYVLLFRPRFRMEGETRIREAVSGFLLRTTDNRSFEFRFRVPAINTEYEFWVEARDYMGQPSPDNEIIRMLIADNVPPAALSAVNGRITSRNLAEISWPVSRSVDAAGYRVYRAAADEEDFLLLTETMLPLLSSTFTDSTALPGVQYRYAVTVIGRNTIESGRSNNAHLLIPDTRRLPALQGIAARFDDGTGQVEVSWQPVPESMREQLRSYRIMRRQLNPPVQAGFTQINDGSWREARITDPGIQGRGFEEGVTYQYGVFAIHQNGNMGDTLFTRLQIPTLSLPDAPTAIQLSVQSDFRVDVSWGGSPSPRVNHYRLYRQNPDTTGQKEPVLLFTGDRNQRFYADESVQLNQRYVYAVSAVDSLGNASPLLFADTLITRRTSPPLPVRNLQLAGNGAGVQLAWQSGDDSSHLAAFRIYRSETAAGLFTLIGETEPHQLSFTDPAGLPGLWYRVSPVDLSGREARQNRAVQAAAN